MKFTSQITVLKANAKSFNNDRGEEIKYNRAVLVDEFGDIMSVGCSQPALDMINGRANVEGVGTFEVSPDFKQKPRLSLVLFEEKASSKK